MYEWLVIPFGFTNASRTLMSWMNHALRICIEKFVDIYFNDILIYCKNLDDQLVTTPNFFFFLSL